MKQMMKTSTWFDGKPRSTASNWLRTIVLLSIIWSVLAVIEAVVFYYANFFAWLEYAIAVMIVGNLLLTPVILIGLKVYSLLASRRPHVRRPLR